MRERSRWIPTLAMCAAACSSDPPAGSANDAGVADTGGGRVHPDVQVVGPEDVGETVLDARPMSGMPGRDPCMGVSNVGRCVSPQQAEYCAAPTGRGTDELISQDCEAGQTCMRGPDGFRCLRTGDCVGTEAECSDEQTLRRCTGGMWQTETCATRCVAGAAGAACAPMAATRMRTGRFRYQARGVRADLRDWSDPSWAGEEGFTVALQRGDDVVATTVTGADGLFALPVPLEPTADDRLVVIPAVFRRGEIVLAMGNPGFAPSRDERSVSRPLPAERRVWAWSWDLAMISAEGRIDLDLPLAQGSGVAEAFAWSRIAWRAAEQAQGRAGKTLITWVSPGTAWTCGACYNGVEHRLNRLSFASQAWLDGGPDEGFWSSSVTVHEMGHWWMDSYSRAPGEGGSHTVGVPTFPGQAWSEGFATFVAADVRNDPLYVDKQDGGIFYISLDRLRFRSSPQSPERGLVRPSANSRDGVMQFLDENWVAASLWRARGTDASPLYRALGSDRMNNDPFGRCYVRHVWEGIGINATDICATTESTTFYADFLDALTCNGFDRARLRASIGAYPYDADNAWCEAGRQPAMDCTALGYDPCRMEVRAPLRLSLTPVAESPGSVRLRATLTRTGWMPGPYAAAMELPPGVQREGGAARFEIPTIAEGASWSTEIALRYASPPATDAVLRVSVDHPGIGWSAAAPYRFGRVEALPAAPGRTAARVRIHGTDLGPAVPVVQRAAVTVPDAPPSRAR